MIYFKKKKKSIILQRGLPYNSYNKFPEVLKYNLIYKNSIHMQWVFFRTRQITFIKLGKPTQWHMCISRLVPRGFLPPSPTPSLQQRDRPRDKPRQTYLSVSLTDSSVVSLYSGTVSFKSMQTLPTNARWPNLSVRHTHKEFKVMFLCHTVAFLGLLKTCLN